MFLLNKAIKTIFSYGYKCVSEKREIVMQILSQENSIKKWIKSMNKDPIINIILKNSSLTKAQLETLLIDVYHRENKNEVNDDLKYFMRSNGKVSRGAFNRTRKQSLRNIIKSINTIILLGYLGLFESTQLDPFIEMGDKIESLKNNLNTNQDSNNIDVLRNIINTLASEIEEIVSGKTYYNN